MWPFRRSAAREPAPEPVFRQESGAWATLPPVAPAVPTHPLTNPLEHFTAGLAAWRNPSFLAPLRHDVDPDAPAGVLHQVVSSGAPAGTVPYPELPVVSRGTAEQPPGSRSAPVWSQPGLTVMPTVASPAAGARTAAPVGAPRSPDPAVPAVEPGETVPAGWAAAGPPPGEPPPAATPRTVAPPAAALMPAGPPPTVPPPRPAPPSTVVPVAVSRAVAEPGAVARAPEPVAAPLVGAAPTAFAPPAAAPPAAAPSAVSPVVARAGPAPDVPTGRGPAGLELPAAETGVPVAGPRAVGPVADPVASRPPVQRVRVDRPVTGVPPSPLSAAGPAAGRVTVGGPVGGPVGDPVVGVSRAVDLPLPAGTMRAPAGLPPPGGPAPAPAGGADPALPGPRMGLGAPLVTADHPVPSAPGWSVSRSLWPDGMATATGRPGSWHPPGIHHPPVPAARAESAKSEPRGRVESWNPAAATAAAGFQDSPDLPVVALPVQRAEPGPAADPGPAPAESPPAATASTTTTSEAPSAPPATVEADQLLKVLYEPLLRRLKTELRLDRERLGAATDLRR